VATKFVPLISKVKPGPPAHASLGFRELIVGTGIGPLAMVKSTEFDSPPPGWGLFTVTGAVPGEAMAAAGMAAVNCVALTNVVIGAIPPKLTVEAATKFVPLTVRAKGALPASTPVGEIIVIVGTRFVLLVMVKFAAFEVPPPGVGLVTVTATVPAEAMAEAGTAAVNCVALTKVVVAAVPPKLTIEAGT
jgi:hypothetical protein